MYMKAKATNVSIGHNNTNSINMRFKHLSSVVRFHITNYSQRLGLESLESTYMHLRDSPNFFVSSAYLDGGIDREKLTPIENDRFAYLIIDMDQLFVNNGRASEFDAFMPVIPTGAPDPTSGLIIKSTLR